MGEIYIERQGGVRSLQLLGALSPVNWRSRPLSDLHQLTSLIWTTKSSTGILITLRERSTKKAEEETDFPLSSELSGSPSQDPEIMTRPKGSPALN